MKPDAVLRLVIPTILIVGGLALTGCSTPKAKPAPTSPYSAVDPRLYLADQLYLLPVPYPRLYVEIDAVEGCVPKRATLAKLQAFLRTYCNKPGGVEIARSDVIPLKAAQGISPSALARKYLNGPPDNPATPPPAFIYVLFYNDAVCGQVPALANGPQPTNAPPGPRPRNPSPHVDIRPYPAMIYMDVNHLHLTLHGIRGDLGAGFKWEQKWNLLHEAGHTLGLAFRPTDSYEGHCGKIACLMSYAGRFRYLAVQNRLCDQCVKQLVDLARQPGATNIHFVGPVLVRSADGYHVLGLPHRWKLVVGDLTDEDCREFAAAVRAETPTPGDDENEWRMAGWLKEDANRSPEQTRAVLNRAKADPDTLVQKVAAQLFETLPQDPPAPK